MKLGRIIIFIVLSLLFTISCKQKEQKKIKTIQTFFVKEQDNYKRNFKNIEIEKAVQYKSNNIYRPILIRVDDEGDIYLYDLSVQKIKMIKNNKTIEFGDGRGKGPKEFSNIVDFRIYANTLYIADNQLNKISEFKKDGTFVRTKNLDFTFHRILPTKNGIIILTSSTSSDKYFMFLDKEYNLIYKFGDRIDARYPPYKKLFFLEGVLCSGTNSTIFYGFYYHGLILSCNIETNKFSYIYTIDKTPMPEIEAASDGSFARAPKNAPISCRSISFDNNKLYVLSFAGEGIDKEKYTVFDVYDAKTVKYEYSFKLPVKLYRAAVKKNVIYAIVNKINIMSWRIKLL
ncbi:hypothetical protein ACX8XN_06100 [Calditrichota bacterium GD2]